MSSHLLSEVSDVCDEVAMIDHGKLLVYDTISNVTSKFSGGSNMVEVGLQRPINPQLVTRNIANIPGVSTAEQINDTSLRIKFSGGLDMQEQILSRLVNMNIGVISYRAASSELEDVYLNLIKDTV
jgi:ABC-2 type transport system ATP-binding protein